MIPQKSIKVKDKILNINKNLRGTMLMKKTFAAILAIVAMIPTGIVSAKDNITIKYNGTEIAFNEKNVVMNERTLVQLRPIAEALDLGIEYALDTGSVILSNEDSVVVFTQNSDIINVNGEDFTMDVPMIIHNNYSFVPVRDLVEPFGNTIVYDGDTETITIVSKTIAEEESVKDGNVLEDTKSEKNKKISTGSGDFDFAFFYQSQPELEFENNGRGYCWVCSYAMLFSGVCDEVITPLDIAKYNIDSGYSGIFMAGHEALARKFGLELVPALSEDSPYYGGFNTKNRGETTLNVASDDEAKAAICEALDNFPGGILVRYEGYPHTMMAVEYDEENIYFNDPAIKNGEHVTFDKTCLKNFNLSDISFVQAVR